MPRHKVKGVPSNGIIIVSDARIVDLIGRWLMITYESTREE